MTSLAEITCHTCEETKPVDQYYRRASNKSGYMGKCISCVRSYQNQFYRKSRQKNPEEFFLNQRKQMLWTKYRMTVEQYDDMLLKQGGSCALCPRTPGQSENFVVDHDHSCCPGARSCGKCIRGILCRPCNTVLGLVNDSPEVLEEAARYLRTAPSEKD